MTALFENYSQKKITPLVNLYQKRTYIVRKRLPKTFEKCYTLYKEEPILPSNTLNWNGKLLRIPSIAPSIMNCRIIKVEYILRITLLISGSLLNLHIELPIVIGTIPYQYPIELNIASTSQGTPSPHHNNDCMSKIYLLLYNC